MATGLHWHPSENFGQRKDGASPKLIVLHYTAMSGTEAALAHLCDPICQVSAHYLISQFGFTWHLVEDHQRAWHAGESTFEGRSGCNDYAIGIELEGMDNLSYTELQYQKLAEVTQMLINCYPSITINRIVGHSDIAPSRKTDPGEAFDWHYFRGLLEKEF